MKKQNQKISRLLIANRGEIACRIMQTAQKMGIHCIALYSDADANALHVKQADEAWHIGPAPAKDSYLVQDKLLHIAKQSKADAIHPGYGFLSENADFAKAVEQAGMIWVGPPASSIEVMGSKTKSKQLMEEASVPLVPGYHGDDQDEALLIAETKKIGFPALIKASAGGGGKGMRVVESESEIEAAIAASKREGLNSFGDDKLLVEKYITRPRHVEIQVFMDQQGNGVYLFERDCSIQRRHQKVVEEAPAPQFSQTVREKMGEAALQAARAINYQGAGTVEFLFDPSASEENNFYFMEMNTRLQVEHPVTEMITGQDLVSWQLKVAQGEDLPLSQQDLSIRGHAMEVRIYAEDPDNEFLPTTGKLEQVQLPKLIENQVRLDTGVTQGDEVSPYYDPMIAKLIVWGQDRQQCLSTLQQALQQYQIAGVTTNLSFLRRVLAVDAFAKGDVSTRFIEEFHDELMIDSAIKEHHLIAGVCHHMLTRKSQGQTRSASNDGQSPWHGLQSFRLNQPSFETLYFSQGEQPRFAITVKTRSTEKWTLELNGQAVDVTARLNPLASDEVQYCVDHQWRKARVVVHDERIWIYDSEGESALNHYQLEVAQEEDAGGSLKAPMNGTLIQIDVNQGQAVKAGDALLIMEAMKMEHCIKAPHDGVVKELSFNVGDLVNEGDVLVELIEPEASI